MAQDAVADQYKVVYDLSIGAIFNDLEQLLTQISRSCQYLMLSISETAKYTAIVAIEGE